MPGCWLSLGTRTTPKSGFGCAGEILRGRLLMKAVRHDRVHRLNGRIVDHGVAVHAACLMNDKICRSDRKGKGAQAFRTGDEDIRIRRFVAP